jgi:hypothetical protein
MTSIERLYLRARHWQIFLLLVGGMILGQMAVLNSLSMPARSPQDLDKAIGRLALLTVPFMLFFLSWFWAIGSFANSLAAHSDRPNIRMFRFALIYPAVYIVAFFVILSRRPDMPAVIVPFHLFAMFCMFYNLYFVAKSLALAETRRTVSFYDFSGPFFLLWFFPIGVWIIQPRINRLFRECGYTRPDPETSTVGGA